MIANIDRVASKAEVSRHLRWNVPTRTTPLDDIRAIREKHRRHSFGMDGQGPRPIVLHQISSEVASYPGTMDELRGQLAEQGIALSETVDICGLEGYRFDRMIVVQTELGVLAGTAEGITKLLDRMDK